MFSYHFQILWISDFRGLTLRGFEVCFPPRRRQTMLRCEKALLYSMFYSLTVKCCQTAALFGFFLDTYKHKNFMGRKFRCQILVLSNNASTRYVRLANQYFNARRMKSIRLWWKAKSTMISICLYLSIDTASLIYGAVCSANGSTYKVPCSFNHVICFNSSKVHNSIIHKILFFQPKGWSRWLTKESIEIFCVCSGTYYEL